MEKWKEGLFDSFKLRNFLSVKAEDQIAKVWHDEKGESIDCNIYHPKYGYKGFVTDESRPIVTFWNSTRYYDANIRKNVYCEHDCQMLCVHPNGSFTNKDNIRVFVENISIPQTRCAENEADYKEVYNRVFKEHNLNDTERVHRVFKDNLLIELKKLINLHKNNSDFNTTLDIELISEAETFMEFLSELDKGNTKLSMKQIALKFVYEGKTITRDNGNEYALQYGFTSGEKLFHLYSHFSSNKNRTGAEDSDLKLKNKIKIIEGIIDFIEDPYKQRAIDEIKILTNIVDKGIL